ncbi:NADPH-dependent FMN reductase [Alkalilimnicola ehrlichii MLHE-1]|uniref:NADPH-dependent FMN reductase n=1 Tax=Alkalilimnicola ehrlichii (strain ATCC BAA-1101 / DSM 17681 / MLHE-1) TaxID=187272 RepID=Q0A533_ALKEH|nr:NAD(P)H-dependent oxidoreductase [Alkalilimnicola ehrlichii]ABI58054.1 NADPH-dependent FMN reductase [Alkalilimnicola ehrlichii MLHE-1]
MKTLIFVGTSRQSTPPRPPRLGLRVARACLAYFNEWLPDHQVELVDPLDLTFGAVFKPHFAYASQQAPDQLRALAEQIEAADSYVMVSPEYNHSMSPVLAHLLNHFGSSLFSYKPSAIVTYSAGQWGGARAAVAMRTFLSELGCLPVSAMIHIPKAQTVLAEDGSFLEGADDEEWTGYMGRTLQQLNWWAAAARAHRQQADPFDRAQAFQRDPSQRNAPKPPE